MVTIFKGPQFYTENDKSIFKGREKETDDLLYLVENNDFSVCYAVSGEGKSSLINAGLCPKLRGDKFLPIHIKNIADAEVNHFDEFVWQKVKDAIKEEQKKPEYAGLAILKLEPKPDSQGLTDSVWWKLRTREFRLNSFETITPVLIFDQFEEVFSSAKDWGWTDAFFAWLEGLYNDENPLAGEYSGKLQKKFKALFSLRSEYVCELDYWAMSKSKYFIPSLKNNRYYLKPLTKEAACEIAKDLPSSDLDILDIVKYAKSERVGEWENIKDNIPCISALILSLLLTALSENNAEIESKIKEINSSDSKDKGKELFDFLLDNVYKKAIEECGEASNERVRSYIEALEDTLIDVNGKRRHVLESDLPSITDDSIKRTLEILKKKRFINVVNNLYEISHDTLCTVVYKHKEARRVVQQREKNIQNAISKAALKRELIVKKSWNDYFLLLPLFLFVTFSVYFLFNAVMNEITFYLDCSTDPLEQEEISAYKELEIASMLKSYHTHLIGNVLMIVWTFLVSNLYVLYSNGYRCLRFKTYDVFVLIGAITLCYWHGEFYATPLHNVFKHISPSNEWYGWQVVYGGLMGIPLFLLILSVINKAKVEKGWKWHDVFFLKPLFSLKATRWYLIILLFVCLYLCIIPEYKRIVSSGESILFVFLIGVLVHSIFEKVGKWGSRFFYYTPIFLLCLCLGYVEFEDVIAWTGDLSQMVMRHPTTYYLLVFGGFIVSEIFICRKYANLRKYSLGKALGTIICVMGMASLLYIGYLPWKDDQLVSPVQRTMSKWEYYISRKDSAYGANFANGRTLIPYMFDSVDVDSNCLFLYSKPEYIFVSRNDSLFKVDTLKANVYEMYNNNTNPIVFKIRPRFAYLYSRNIPHNASIIENKIGSAASATYREILNNVFQRVKYGKALSSVHVTQARNLIELVSGQADSLYSKLSCRNTSKVLPNDSLMLYFEAVVREFSILALKDVMDSNDLFTTAYVLDLFADSFFHQIVSGEQVVCTKNYNLHSNITINYGTSSNQEQVVLNVKALYNNTGLTLYDINCWQQLWETLYAQIRQFVATNWAYNYKNVVESLPVDRANKYLLSTKVSKEDLLRAAISMLGSLVSPDNLKGQQRFDDKTRSILNQFEKNQKEIREISQDIKEKFKFQSANVDIGNACKKRMKQIQELTKNTMYASFGRVIVREMMAIRMFCDFDSKVLDEANILLNDMYQKDSTLIKETYSDILKIQNSTLICMKLVEQIDGKVKSVN